MADNAATFQMQPVPAKQRRINPGGPRRGRGHDRGQAQHATIDLQGARDGLVTEDPASLGHAAAVYSTGEGGVESYHYHRADPAEQLYATREDMQLQTRERAPTPGVKGPGQ